MRRERLTAKPVASVNKPVRPAVHIRVIDLGRIANHDQLRSTGHARHHGLGFERRELLGLVEHEEAVRNRAAANVAERLDFEQTSLNELLVGFHDRMMLPRMLHGRRVFPAVRIRTTFPTALRLLKRQKHLASIVNGLQPGVHFFIQRSGKKAQRVTHGDDRTAHGEAIEIIPAGEIKPRRDGKERFAGSCLTVAGHKRDRGIQQSIQEALLPRVGRSQFDSPRDLEIRRNVKTRQEAFAIVSCWEVLRIRDLQQNILVQIQSPQARGGQLDGTRTAETLQLVRLNFNRT